MEDQLARLAKEVNTYFDAVSLTGGKNHLMDSPCPDISWQIPHLVPEGSTAMPAKSPGTCVPCGQKYSKNRLLVRALSWDAYSEKWVGHKVCKGCSPSYSDQQVIRLTIPMEDWSSRWKMGLDDNVLTMNGKAVPA